MITVVGGSGFVGSRVVQRLAEGGASVRAVSRSGRPPKWCEGAAWCSGVEWVANDLTRGSRGALEAAVGAPDVLVSCVGTIGFDVQGGLIGNGQANVAAAQAASEGGCKDFVFVSVASEVAACEDGWLPAYFSGCVGFFYISGGDNQRRARRTSL